MPNLPQLVWLFVGFQSLYIALDLFAIWNHSGRPSLPVLLKERRPPLLFLTGVSAAYLAIHDVLMRLLSMLSGSAAWLFDLLANPHSLGQTPNTLPVLWSLALLSVGAYLTAGFWDYVAHRWLLHKPLWLLHESHHLPTQVFNGMPGITFRPYGALSAFLTSFPTAATLMVIGRFVPDAIGPRHVVEMLPYLLVIFALFGSAAHSSFLRDHQSIYGPLKVVCLTTPREHLLHHSVAFRNYNYGNFSTLWDRVFGTYLDPINVTGEPLRLGLPYDQDFLGAVTAGKVKLSASLRGQWKVGSFCFLSHDSDLTAPGLPVSAVRGGQHDGISQTVQKGGR